LVSTRPLILGALVLLLGEAAAGGEPRAVGVGGAPGAGWRLTLTRAEEAASCPSAETLRAEVERLLGRQPFGEQPAGRELQVAWGRDARGFSARLALREPDGWTAGERLLVSREADCEELFAAVALAIAIAIDPWRGIGQPSSSPSSSLTPAAPPAAPPAPPPAPPPLLVAAAAAGPPAAASRIQEAAPAGPKGPERGLVLGLGLAGVHGRAPDITWGGLVRGGVRGRWGSLHLEGRVDRAAALTPASGGEVRAGVADLAVLPCVHQDPLGGCLVVTGGIVRGRGEELTGAREAWGPYVAAGVRPFVELWPGSWLGVQAWAELLVPFGETVLRLGETSLWQSPRVSFALGVALQVTPGGRRFP